MGPEALRLVHPANVGARARAGLAAACGASVALGHAPFGLWPLALLSLAAGLAVCARAGSWRGGFAPGWAMGVGYFAVTLHWIVEPFLVDVARHGWMAPFALVLMAGGLALFWGLGAALGRGLAGPAAPPGRRHLALAAGLTLAEILRSILFTGFPWALVGTIWIDTPLAMLAALVGPFGLTLATLLLAALLATGLGRRDWRRRGLDLAACAALLLAAGGAGLALARRAGVPPVADAPVIRIVQPNEEQHLKWDPDAIPLALARKIDLTAAPEGARTDTGPGLDAPPHHGAVARPAAVVWPEVSLPYLLDGSPETQAAIAGAAQGAAVILGAQRFGPEGGLHNSLAILAADGRVAALYDKHHLVPFGEYFPGGGVARRLGLTGLATDVLGGFDAGSGPRLLDLAPAGLGQVLPLICYEAIFPQYAHAPGGRADWMVQITNDAWFGTFAGPQQHLDQARMRAIEQGLPLVRAANTGISALIDPSGRVLAELPLDMRGAIDVALPAPRPPTAYARTGNWPAFLALAGLAGGLLATRARFRD